ncbi:SusD/RagB family nutrient-binding outer membrane lipoprotein [Maribacter luteus]|uniref:SusD/RagB family nutrient-binding outer membrane lipoprotein n=1 Tax=Maribacter luteus TaxID=2594478 RepID=UPI00249171D4|nr:SusD/RagB family nutrient-binding outer membrane lipoprotein [Maribacter luteus]
MKITFKFIQTYFKKTAVFFGALIAFSGCESTQLEILNDPNALTPEQADIDLFLNNIQLGTVYFFESDNTDNFNGVSEMGAKVSRLLAMTAGNQYVNAYVPESMNEVWEDAYSDVLIDVHTMIPLAEEQELWTHIAYAQILEAYVTMTLVDFFGDVPYFTALQGAENLNPAVDSGAEIYAAVEELLNTAIVNLNKTELASPANDIFYDGDESKWIKLANTLKLKLYIQTRLVDSSVSSKINALIAEGNLIESSEDDFFFQYSSVDANPDSRHPIFTDNFDAGKTDYQSNWFMNFLYLDKSVPDPRIRYYFYRQELDFSEADNQTKECVNESAPSHFDTSDVFCTVADGYWGRDHGDDDGIPPDDAFVTLHGVYPVGGPFDDNSGDPALNRTFGLQGAGISPIMMSSYVDFMLAESALTLGTTGDARVYLETGIRESIDKVMNFGESLASASPIFMPTQDNIDTFVDEVLAEFDGADNEGKLEVIVEQYFTALFGNGVEAYNTYRRTGFPDMQPTVLPNPGIFMRTFPYPANLVDQNSSVSQKPISVQVFWDNNPGDFID